LKGLDKLLGERRGGKGRKSVSFSTKHETVKRNLLCVNEEYKEGHSRKIRCQARLVVGV